MIAIGSFLLLLFIMFAYLIKNNPVYKGDCWCCSKKTLLTHDQVTSGWYCTHCGGYNGFNEDGDYNKPIGKSPLKHQQFVVRPQPIVAIPFAHNHQQQQGLCSFCQAKMYENFNFSRLHDAPLQPITLCPRCDMKVENKIQQVDANVKKIYPTVTKILHEKSQSKTLYAVHRMLLILLVIHLLGEQNPIICF